MAFADTDKEGGSMDVTKREVAGEWGLEANKKQTISRYQPSATQP